MFCIGAVIFGLFLGAKANLNLEQLEQKFIGLEKRVSATEQQLQHGGKRYQTVPFSKCMTLL